MQIRIIGPVCQTGYGAVTTGLVTALAKVDDVETRLLTIGSVDKGHLLEHEGRAVEEAIQRSYDRAGSSTDITLCVWHEWDHPPSMFGAARGRLGNYAAAPIFELDRLRLDAFEPLSKCWRVLAPTQFAKSALVKAGLPNVHLLNFMGIDDKTFRPKPAGYIDYHTFKVLNVGKQEFRKGHDLVYRAAAHLLAKGIKDFQFWCMWSNPFIPAVDNMAVRDRWLMDAAAEVGIDPSDLHAVVRMVKPVKNAVAMAEVIHSCHVGLYPFRAEGWNLPLLEAMACAKPVITTHATGPTEYLNDKNSYLVDYEGWVDAHDGVWFDGQGQWVEPSLDDIVNHLVHLYKEWKPHGVVTLNLEGAKTAEEFSWNASAHKIRDWMAMACGVSS